MSLFVLFSDYHDGENPNEYPEFLGIFSTPEMAQQYAEDNKQGEYTVWKYDIDNPDSNVKVYPSSGAPMEPMESNPGSAYDGWFWHPRWHQRLRGGHWGHGLWRR